MSDNTVIHLPRFSAVLSQRSTPVKMSQEAASKLPRWSLLMLLAVFALGALWAGDLWTMRDAESFGMAIAMLRGGPVEWFLPSVVDAPLTGSGPMTGWLTAILIWLFGTSGGGLGIMSDMSAMRLAAALWFAGTTAALWYGTWHLARRPEAQPIAFAFGGEASPRDYGRVVADAAVLLFVATFGIVTRQHEALPDTALLTMAALNFYGLTVALHRPAFGNLLAGFAAGAALLAATLFSAFWLLLQSLLVAYLLESFPGDRRQRISLILIGAFVAVIIWPLLAFAVAPDESRQWFALWLIEQGSLFGLTRAETWLWFGRNAVWYLCPIWPFVLWGIYSWRRQLGLTHIALPLTLAATGLIAAVFSSHQAADTVFLTFLPPLAVTAAFGLVTVPRSKENVLDWFSITIFSLGVLTLWAYWFAWLTAFAPKMAKSLQMLAPGSSPVFDSGFLFAAVTTVFWFAFVSWRLTHRPIVIWRGPWLSAAGMTAFSAALIGLFHTGITINRSYEPLVHDVIETLALGGKTDADCVSSPRLNPGIQAVFLYYGNLAVLTSPDAACRFVLHRTRQDNVVFDNMIGGPLSRPHTDESFTVTVSQ